MQLVPNNIMREMIQVEVVPGISEWVLDFFSCDEEAEEDGGEEDDAGDGEPFHLFDDLERESEAVASEDDPEMDAVGVRDRGGENAFQS